MRLRAWLLCIIVLSFITLPVFCQAPPKEYEVNKVSVSPPVIDGEYSDEEWAGSEWAGDFYGLRHSANQAQYQGEIVDINWRWRALWDDDYFYVLIVADLNYLNPNGMTYPDVLVDPSTATSSDPWIDAAVEALTSPV